MANIILCICEACVCGVKYGQICVNLTFPNHYEVDTPRRTAHLHHHYTCDGRAPRPQHLHAAAGEWCQVLYIGYSRQYVRTIPISTHIGEEEKNVKLIVNVKSDKRSDLL